MNVPLFWSRLMVSFDTQSYLSCVFFLIYIGLSYGSTSVKAEEKDEHLCLNMYRSLLWVYLGEKGRNLTLATHVCILSYTGLFYGCTSVKAGGTFLL